MGILTGTNITIHIKDVHIHGVDASELKELLQSFNVKIDNMANELDNLATEVSENTSATQSAITLLNGLKAKLDEAIASGDMSQVQALSDQLSANTDALSAAVAANTPAEEQA